MALVQPVNVLRMHAYKNGTGYRQPALHPSSAQPPVQEVLDIVHRAVLFVSQIVVHKLQDLCDGDSTFLLPVLEASATLQLQGDLQVCPSFISMHPLHYFPLLPPGLQLVVPAVSF